MVRYYDPLDRTDLARMERRLTRAGVEYVVTRPPADSPLPGTIGIAEEDLPRVEALLAAKRRATRH